MVKKTSTQFNIAVIGAKGIPPKQGGIEHHCSEIYSRIAKKGYCVDLYARSSYTQFPWYHCHQFQGVRVISLPSLRLPGIDALLSAALGAIAGILRQYNVIHFHAVGIALFCWLPRLFTSAKVVVTCHGLDWQRSKWGKLSSLLIYWGERAAVNYAHEIIVVSEALQAYFWKVYGRETIYIPNAPITFSKVDLTFQYGQSLELQPQRYIIFVGRLVPEKAPDLLIQAFQKFRPTGWKLLLVGEHSDTSMYVTHLRRLAGEDEDIIFTGQLLGKRLAEVVQGAGLFVLPSKLEGMPLSLMEAMQEGIPVVASNIQPHRELVGEDRGILFDDGNLDSCVEALRRAIAQPEEMALRAKRAKTYIRSNYSWDKSAVDTVCLYRFLTYTSDISVARDNSVYTVP